MRASFLQNHCSIYCTLIVVRAVSSFATFGQSVYRSTVTWTKNFQALSLTMQSHPAPLANLTFFALDWPQGRVSRLCECLAVGIVADFCLVRVGTPVKNAWWNSSMLKNDAFALIRPSRKRRSIEQWIIVEKLLDRSMIGTVLGWKHSSSMMSDKADGEVMDRTCRIQREWRFIIVLGSRRFIAK